MRARLAITPLAITLCCCIVSTTTIAGQQCSTITVPSTITNWNQTVAVPRFDPALGTLTSVTIMLDSTMAGSEGMESLDQFPQQVTSFIAVSVSLSRPDNTTLVSLSPTVTFVDNLTAFDGTIDFAGTSGVTHAGINAQLSGQVVLLAPGDIALFSGPSGNPGTVGLPASAQGVSVVQGGPLITQISTQAAATITVCYDYTSVATSFCAGDGTAAACPCGNASALGAGQGCLNSTGAGARLVSSGNASVSNDTLVLSCSGVPGATTVLFFQGTAQLSGGNGAVFGDGLRCVGGTIARLRIEFASGGVATYPQAGDAPISVTGSVPANAVRHYQTWYRNAAVFCTTSTFNLSGGLTVTWSP